MEFIILKMPIGINKTFIYMMLKVPFCIEIWTKLFLWIYLQVMSPDLDQIKLVD